MTASSSSLSGSSSSNSSKDALAKYTEQKIDMAKLYAKMQIINL